MAGYLTSRTSCRVNSKEFFILKGFRYHEGQYAHNFSLVKFRVAFGEVKSVHLFAIMVGKVFCDLAVNCTKSGWKAIITI